MKLNKGFTLAEALVTLAIIGVIASLTIPGLLRNAPNREQIMLKKAYYLVSRNVNEMINDEELYPERDIANRSGFSNVDISDQTADGRQALFHGQRYGGARGTAAANGKFCNLMAARMNIRGNIDCNRARTVAQGGNFTTADGIVWSIPFGDFRWGNDDSNQTIEVDVNGTNGRNCHEVIGSPNACPIPDRFNIIVDRYGRITVPANGIEQEYLTRTATNTSFLDIRKGVRR